MLTSNIRYYFTNCFLLILPVLVWNVALTTKLPEAFQQETVGQNSSRFLMYSENSSRLIVFGLTLLMPLRISTRTQKIGLLLYLGGIVLYFIFWSALIYCPDSTWSTSLLGFMAPAYTPFFWLMSIGLIGDSFYVNLLYKRLYFVLASIVFLLFHNVNTVMLYYRTH